MSFAAAEDFFLDPDGGEINVSAVFSAAAAIFSAAAVFCSAAADVRGLDVYKRQEVEG